MPREPQINAESVRLMQALLARPDAAAVAAGAFRKAYPDAPQAMIDAAVFHVVIDGVEATVDWLAAVERFIRDPSEGLDFGAVWHVVYHLYNWLQFEALMPMGATGLKEHLGDVKHFIEEDDKEAALDVLKRLVSAIEGDAGPPGIG